MKVPLNWLRSYVDLPEDANTVAEHLAALGFPVESIEKPPTITNVVVGRITKIEPHPNADRLQLCTIDIAGARTLTIATAATNVAQDQVIPVAQIGAQLPEMRIEPRKMRGVDSEGMLCSAAELGLPAAWFEDGILQLDRNLPLGANIVTLLGLHEPVLDVEVTTNRPDVLSLIGIARELSALLETPLWLPEGLDFRTLSTTSDIKIDLASPDATAFLAIEVRNLTGAHSPIAMRVRLAQAGVRPIDALVDITNFVMLEYGRPLHFYDADKIADHTFVVRDAKLAEKLTTLDDVERELKPEHLIVADSQKALGIAGIFGGADSGISTTTKTAILECAQFTGARVRRGAASLGLRTEASGRFEKGLARGLIQATAARAAKLITHLGATVCKPVSAGNFVADDTTIRLEIHAVKRLLGFDPGAPSIRSTLERLGFTVTGTEPSFEVQCPVWREDVRLPADLIEEIARLIGYDTIEPALAPIAPATVSSNAFLRERDVALSLSRAGFQEAVSLALEPASVRERFAQSGCEPALPSLEIRNPLSEDQRYLRFSLLPAMLSLLSRRSSELRDGDLHFFEIGHCFADCTPPVETRTALWCSARRKTTNTTKPWTNEHVLAFKGRTETALRALLGETPLISKATLTGLHPGKTAEYRFNNQMIATIGAVDPRLLAAYELDMDVTAGFLSLDTLPDRSVVHYKASSRFPSVMRDLALVLPKTVAAANVIDVIRNAEPLARRTDVFDEFHGPAIGENFKSLALHIALQRDDSTLTDEDADASLARILEAVKRELGAELRK